MMRDENGMLTGYVYVDVAGRDLGSYVAEANARAAAKMQLPAGLRDRLERPVRSDGSASRSGCA